MFVVFYLTNYWRKNLTDGLLNNASIGIDYSTISFYTSLFLILTYII